MKISIHTTPGYYEINKAVIEIVEGNKFSLSIEIDGGGNLKIQGAHNVEYTHRLDEKVKVYIKAMGVEGGIDAVLSSDSLRGCLILTKENDKPLIKARDGLGSWNKEKEIIFEKK